MGLYQKFILPRLIDMAMRNKEVAARRAQLIPKASGVVLEVGIGSGLNLPFFLRTITHLAGVDPSAELLSLARRKLGGVSFPVALFCRSAEELPFHERSFDTVVLTWTLCSIADPTQALAEVKRVLKPDGRLLFVEHGLSSDAKVQKWQHRLTRCGSASVAVVTSIERSTPLSVQLASALSSCRRSTFRGRGQ
jgi:ubiquinone/menaquinone biosynthesis C-methylase UbiE